ncbi:MAG: T9SS type A sorting domain-containing protein [Bacteroidia bacterium]|nr:T9SS type A sorting domain-containing protein [Bacteroidia bacterium]
MTKIYKSLLGLSLLFLGVKSNAQVSAYGFTQLSGTYNAIPISGPTTTAICVGNQDDNVFPNIPIGFNFTFNGGTYSAINVCVNGWISMSSATAPFNTYNPISVAGTPTNVIAFFGRDLQMGPGQTCTVTSGSNIIPLAYPATAANNFAVGDTISGTGIPTNATIQAITAGSLIISSPATANSNLVLPRGSISYQVSGTAPNQVFTVQWRRVGRYWNQSTGVDDYYNVQIKLYQTTNLIEIVYGACGTMNAFQSTGELGLKGNSNTDYNNRTVAIGGPYATSNPGSSNAATVAFDAATTPATGQIYRWTPPAACSGVPNAGTVTGSQTICPNTTAIITNTSSNAFTGITYQWMQAPTATGPWTNVTTGSGFNTTSLTTASLTSLTFYQLVITCTNTSQSATTAVTSVNPNNPVTLCYCNTNLGGSGCSPTDIITNVSILGTPFNNTSSCNNSPINGTYSNFPPGPGTTATLNIGVTYSISVNTTANNIESLWIDYNQNGIFDASEHTQICLISTPSVATVATFTIPGTALLGQTGMRVRSRLNGNQNGPNDACLSMGSGETEDYIVTIAAATACSGTPGANTVVASQANVCPNGSVTLGLANSYTVGGLTYQWYTAPAVSGPYTAVSGATVAVYTATNLTANTFFQAVITCTNGPASVTATPVQVTVSGNPCQCGGYCNTSLASSTNDDEIFNVNIGTLNNTSTCSQTGGPGSILNRYSNYAGMVAAPNLTVANNYTLNVTVGQCNTGSYSGGVTVYIDYNQNGSFADPGEQVFVGPSTLWAIAGTLNTTVITIPASATPGITRMRVIAVEGGIGTGDCAGYTWGETEDYCVNIAPGTPCAGAPAANSAVASQTNVCPAGSSNLSLATSYTVGGLTYQWYTAPAVSGPYTAVSGATTSAYTFTNISASLFYQAVITCTNGPASTTSSPVQVLVGGSPCQCQTFCASSANSVNDDEIFNVSIGTLNNTSNCSQTGGPGSILNRYSNYAGVIAAPTLQGAVNYTLSITAGQCNSFAYSGIITTYIDFNQNGSFGDPGELVYTSVYTPFQITGTTFTTVVQIPANATVGTTRMRVICAEVTTPQPDCGTYGWGETEDYCVNIIAPVPCTGSPAANTSVANQTMVCSGGSSTVNVANSYTVGGLSYQWQTATSLAGPYTSVAGATTVPYVFTNITNPLYYRVVITCSSSPVSTTATPVYINILGAPVYATLPFLENFDNTWQNRCDNHNVPIAANWDSNPTTGDDSWRRQDDGATANWSSSTFTQAPLTGAGCADFHSWDNFSQGDLMLYVNLGSAATHTLSFYHVNAFGDDSLGVYLSTDGGATYNYQASYVSGDYSPIDASWNKKTIVLNSASSPTCVVKFSAYGDFTDDIGMDSLQIQSSCAAPVLSLTASQSTICNGSSSNLTASGATSYTWSTGPNTASISVSPSVTTTYTVTGHNVPGCTASKTIAVTVNPSPTLAVAPSTSICPGANAVLSATSSAANYTWNPGNFTTSAITVSPSISTVYNVATTNSLGCVTNSNVTVFVVVCTGIAKNTVIDNNTFIYPNPNNGSINVIIQDANGSYAFEVLDLAGRVVYKTTLSKAENALSIKELANGLYTYKITSLTTKVAIKEGKLIKE